MIFSKVPKGIKALKVLKRLGRLDVCRQTLDRPKRPFRATTFPLWVS